MKSFLVLALAVIVGPAALAQSETFAVNPDASEVQMTLNTTREVVNGTFHVQSGSINLTAPLLVYREQSSSQRTAARRETTGAIKR